MRRDLKCGKASDVNPVNPNTQAKPRREEKRREGKKSE
jgi:hypothetical protein